MRRKRPAPAPPVAASWRDTATAGDDFSEWRAVRGDKWNREAGVHGLYFSSCLRCAAMVVGVTEGDLEDARQHHRDWHEGVG